jgi:predicted DNA-binding protein
MRLTISYAIKRCSSLQNPLLSFKETTMSAAATLSFRVPTSFAEQTKQLASMFNMSSSDYVREAVREKNERALQERMVFLSQALSRQSLAENQAMDVATGDGLA